MEKENQTNIFQQGPYPNLDKTKLAAWLRAHSLLREVENIRSPACTPSKTPCPVRPSQELQECALCLAWPCWNNTSSVSVLTSQGASSGFKPRPDRLPTLGLGK